MTPSRVVVDYSAPNVAKEMHAGHLRTTVIGDALVRMFDFMGHDVIRENHIGDWGRPFGMLIEHLLDIGEDVAAAGCARATWTGSTRRPTPSSPTTRRSPSPRPRPGRRLQGHDPETIAIWQRLVDMSTDYFNLVYRRLGVLLTDDDLMGESKYQDLMPVVYARLEEQGLVRENDGAMVVFPPGSRTATTNRSR